MTDRESRDRLIDLLYDVEDARNDTKADHLIENGATIPVRCGECKYNVANMHIDENDITDYSGTDIVCSYHMSDGFDADDYCSKGQ